MTNQVWFPPEWAPQSGVLLTWPHAFSDWQPLLEQVEPVWVRIALEVSRREKLLIACRDEAHRAYVERWLREAGAAMARVSLAIAPSDDSWARDHGPITVYRDGAPWLLDFRFNGWGNKYPAAQDDQLTRRLHTAGAFGTTPLQSLDLALEGGSIETDGAGTLLATSRCLLSPSRNPGLSRAGLEAKLQELLGVQRMLWLEHGELLGDDTDGHIDTLARFCDRETIAYVTCPDQADPHHTELTAMEQALRVFVTAHGKPYRLVPLPLPQARYDESGQRLPATYANFLILNDAVLLPVYQDPADAVARERIASCFPDREVITIDCLPLIRQYGSLHCVTMQLPAGVL
jgi:agmatine/peptidylarginine deiminase